MTAIDVTQTELTRLLVVDAADKARRAKISAKALEREARKRERRAQAGAAAAEVPGAFAGGGGAGQAADETFALRPGETRRFSIGDATVTATFSPVRTWPRTLWLLSLGVLLGIAACAGGQAVGWW